MKYRDLYRKFEKELLATLRNAVLNAVKSVEDATDKLPEDEVLAAWRKNPVICETMFAEIKNNKIIISFGVDSNCVFEFDFDRTEIDKLNNIFYDYYDFTTNEFIAPSFVFTQKLTTVVLNFSYDEYYAFDEFKQSYTDLNHDINVAFSECETFSRLKDDSPLNITGEIQIFIPYE
jgi:hypothetical protein